MCEVFLGCVSENVRRKRAGQSFFFLESTADRALPLHGGADQLCGWAEIGSKSGDVPTFGAPRIVVNRGRMDIGCLDGVFAGINATGSHVYKQRDLAEKGSNWAEGSRRKDAICESWQRWCKRPETSSVERSFFGTGGQRSTTHPAADEVEGSSASNPYRSLVIEP